MHGAYHILFLGFIQTIQSVNEAVHVEDYDVS